MKALGYRVKRPRLERYDDSPKSHALDVVIRVSKVHDRLNKYH